jgi:hypothetical protein
MFAADRDLLVIEPNLFRDVSFLSQRLLKTTGSISAGVLTLTSGDAAAVGIDAGHVVLHEETALEVTERLSSTTLAVSLLRASVDDPAIPPSDVGSGVVIVATFAPQIALVHETILAMLGIDSTGADGSLAEAQILNPRELMRVEALGALHLVYDAAAPLAGPDSAVWARAAMYRSRTARERWRAAARVDLDGDGLADATRRLSVAPLRRA